MKKIIVVVMFLIFVVYSSGCSSGGTRSTIKSQTLLELTDLKSKVVTKIVFIDGRGWNKPLTVENKQKIDEFLNYFDKIRIRKADSSERKVGWIHSAIFYHHDKKIVEITFGNPININKGKYFTVIKNELSTKKIDEYLKSINPNRKTTR